MCGLFGAQWREMPRPSLLGKLYTLLSAANDKRGGQSWGVWMPEKGRRRGMGALAEGLPVEAIEAPMVMAHSRWATRGEKTKNNSHPFKVGRIVGAHNGIIYNHEELSKKYNRNFEVDSQHIFAHLDEGKSLSELEGYGTIEWVDKNLPSRINLAKLTDSGDLAVATVKGFGVVWNSDERALKDALTACRLPFTLMQVDPHVYYYVEDGAYWQVKSVKYEIQSRRISPVTTYGGSSYGSGYGYRGFHSIWGDGEADDKPTTDEPVQKTIGYTTSDGGRDDKHDTFKDGAIRIINGRTMEKVGGVWVDTEMPKEEDKEYDEAIYAQMLLNAELENRGWDKDPALEMLMEDDLQHYASVMNGHKTPDGKFASIVEDLDMVRNATDEERALLFGDDLPDEEAKEVA